MAKSDDSLAGSSTPEPVKKKGRGVGKPFQKGQSGNPGGRSKEIAKLQADLLSMSPDAVKAMGEALRGPDEEEMAERGNDYFWLKAWADKRMAALKLWLTFTLPPPKHGDEFDKPMNIPAAQDLNTLSLLSEAKTLVATEIARLRSVSATGVPLSETASARLTECVKQLSVLIDQEKKVMDTDDFAKLSESELRERVKVAMAEEKIANAN